MLSAKEQMLLNALEPRAAAEGVEIVTVELSGAEKGPLISIFIDTEDGVGFDELMSAQSWIDEIIEEIDPFPGAYRIEVSSPGIERPLRTIEHFKRFLGERAVVKTIAKVDGSKTIKGVIGAVNDESIVVNSDDGEERTIELSNIKKAHLEGVFEF